MQQPCKDYATFFFFNDTATTEIYTLSLHDALPISAGALAVAAAVVALGLAPAIDGRQPWWDYENWALSASTTDTTSFSWDHDYSPLTWPRDGREMLRVKARVAAYWKARDLDLFSGGS